MKEINKQTAEEYLKSCKCNGRCINCQIYKAYLEGYDTAWIDGYNEGYSAGYNKACEDRQ